MKHLILAGLIILACWNTYAQTEFSQDNATRLLKTLSIEIGPRPMGSPAEQRALHFAVGKFKEYGCDTAYVMEMPYSTRANTTSGIAIGIKHGERKTSILVGGHIDSAGPEIPGADDDGSGAVTVMEAARILCKRPMQSTLVFCCWGGEEQGLEGSKYFVDHYADLDSVALMLQVDMANGIEKIDLDPDTHLRSAPQWLVRAAIEEFYGLGYEHLGYATHFYSVNYAGNEGAGSDHESFLRKGIPAIDFTTDITKPIHTPRDNFENFDPRGLKRTGDVIVKLVNRFDDGVPSRETERYWLYLIGKTPVFVPIPVIWAFAGIALALAMVALIVVRKRREPIDAPGRILWSGVKMLLLSGIIVSCAWFSSDVIGIVKNIRHPWMANIPPYYLLAGIAACIGVWISVKLSGTLKLSRCPYVFFKRASILLVVFLILLGLANVKLLVEPSVAIFLISLAILFRNPFLKMLLLALSPWWMIEVVFSEWSPLFFRGAAIALPADLPTWLIVNGVMVVVLTVYILPLLYAAAAVIRDSSPLSAVIRTLRSLPALAVLVIAFALMGGYLVNQPSYDSLWYKDLRVDQRFEMNNHKKYITIKSGEYLQNLRVSRSGGDTLLDTHGTDASLIPTGAFDTTWFRLDRQEQHSRSGDATTFDIVLTLTASMRPYQVIVSYNSGKDKITWFDTRWQFRNDAGARSISWYSFPDSILSIPLRIQVAGNDSLRESIEAIFDSLAEPMRIDNKLSYVLPRTRYSATHTYRP